MEKSGICLNMKKTKHPEDQESSPAPLYFY